MKSQCFPVGRKALAATNPDTQRVCLFCSMPFVFEEKKHFVSFFSTSLFSSTPTLFQWLVGLFSCHRFHCCQRFHSIKNLSFFLFHFPANGHRFAFNRQLLLSLPLNNAFYRMGRSCIYNGSLRYVCPSWIRFWLEVHFFSYSACFG